MPAWPIDLPQLPFDGVAAQDDDAVARTQMDTGPSTRRNRFNTHMQRLTMPMVLTGAEMVDFASFYRSTLSNGALAFAWIDPADDTVTVSLAFTAPVQWSLRGGAARSLDRTWVGVMELEIQP